MMNHLDIGDTEVFDALKDVGDESSTTNWALFGYVPKTARLKFLFSGDGDVSEMASEMSDGKLHFGYLRHEMSETWKYVVIAWCGEGVPATLKGHFTAHTSDFEAYLRKNNFNYSALISARTESDLEESEIIKALNKTSTFIRARTKQQTSGPSLKDTRNNYWTKQAAEEEQMKQDRAAAAKRRAEEDARSRAQMEEKLRSNADAVLRQREAEREERVYSFRKEQDERSAQQQQRMNQQIKRFESSVADRNAAIAERSAPPPPAARTAPAPAPAARRPPPPAARPEPEPEPEPEQTYEEEQTYAEEQTYEEEQTYTEEQTYGEEQTYEEEQTYGEEQGYGEEEQSYGNGGQQQARALYSYEAAQEGDLAFNEGDIINVIDTSDPSGWWQGEINGYTGTFPSNFVELI